MREDAEMALDEREATEAMAETFGAEERENMESQSLYATPRHSASLQPTAELVAQSRPLRHLGDDDVAGPAYIRREALERHRSD